MSEFERFIHLIVSLQMLFGSRRGGLLFPLLLVAVGVGGWFAYGYYFGIDSQLRRADALWDSGDSGSRNSAVLKYKDILQRKEFWEPSTLALHTDRDRLYRRIIQHHVLFDLNQDDARDWIKNAWDERFTLRDMNFGDEAVIEFWKEVEEKLKRSKGKFTSIRRSSALRRGFGHALQLEGCLFR